jgi:octaprenyl-diphosphate synthase
MEAQVLRPQREGLSQARRTAPLPPIGRCFELVATEMGDCERELAGQLVSVVPAVGAIAVYLNQAGGKRVRPLLTALGARAAGHDGPLGRLLCVGEMIHLGSLLHDDVVDEGQERRGRPAAQLVYGNAGVILTGDFCLARGVMLAAEEAGLTATTELCRVVADMSEGEVVQLLHAGDVELRRETHLEVIDKKSARLIAWCASAGAWAIGQPALAGALHTYGREIGVAFQITDDVLDYVGDKRLTGKRRGQDLLEGKVTLPLLYAMERLPTLRARLRQGPPSPERVPALLEEIVDSGATEAALQEARERVARGQEALEQALPDTPWRGALLGLGAYLVERVA